MKKDIDRAQDLVTPLPLAIVNDCFQAFFREIRSFPAMLFSAMIFWFQTRIKANRCTR